MITQQLSYSFVVFDFCFTLPENSSLEPLETPSLKECKQRGQNYNESRELVMRWMQLATFLPVIRYARLPSDCDPQVLQLTKNLTSLRQQIVSIFKHRYKTHNSLKNMIKANPQRNRKSCNNWLLNVLRSSRILFISGLSNHCFYAHMNFVVIFTTEPTIFCYHYSCFHTLYVWPT